MINADLIERLRNAATFGTCLEAADALELADKRIAELEKEAQFNFEQYQDAGRLLCEANEKLAVAREACKDIRRAIERECYAAAYIIVSEALAQIGGEDGN